MNNETYKNRLIRIINEDTVISLFCQKWYLCDMTRFPDKFITNNWGYNIIILLLTVMGMP